MSEKLAEVLSVVLGPHVWLPVLLVVSLFKTGLRAEQIYILLPSLFLLQVIVPLAYIQIALKLGKISAWDMPKIKERFIFLVVTLIFYLIALIFIYHFGNRLLLTLSLVMLGLMMVMVVTTHFWKISLHTGMNTVGSIIINFLFNWSFPWVLLTIPLIFWARLKLKRHNIYQLLAGVLVNGVILLGLFHLLGYSQL